MSTHHATFHDRLSRIQTGQGITKTTVFVGMDLSFSYQPRNRKAARKAGAVFANVGYALSFPFCILLGIFSHALQLYASYVLTGLPDPKANVDLEMIKTALAGGALVIVLTHLIGMRDRGLLVPKLLGVATGMLFFHNLVHLYPRVFETVFSTVWATRLMAMTEPHSIFWRGISISF
ncbi:MAG: hypothetical protein WAT09_18095 [Paracoccaceae bacterium]